MNRPDDDTTDMTILYGDLDDPTIDALLSRHDGAVPSGLKDVADLFGQLHGIVEAPAVPPSPALEAMLTDGLEATAGWTPVTTQRRQSWRRTRQTALALGLTAAIGVPAVGVAAAQERLPDWAQSLVESLIETATPFSLPAPDPASPDGSEPLTTGPGYESDPGRASLPRPATSLSEENTNAGDRVRAIVPPASLDSGGQRQADRDSGHVTGSSTTPQPTASSTSESTSSSTRDDASPSAHPTAEASPTSTSAASSDGWPTGGSSPTTSPTTSPTAQGQPTEVPASPAPGSPTPAGQETLAPTSSWDVGAGY